MLQPSVFKAYDIRGIYPSEIDEAGVGRIADAYARYLNPKVVVVGYDVRLSGRAFKDAAIQALTARGVDVIDIGLVSTDTLYFAVAHLKADGGLMATASHNPKEFGGLKVVREEGRPISADSGLYTIRDMALESSPQKIDTGDGATGTVHTVSLHDTYIAHMLHTFDVASFTPTTIVANTNFGMASPALHELAKHVPITLAHVLNNTLDGTFPKGRPDPLREENRGELIELIQKTNPRFGAAWDGDADRCFFFDERGTFVTPAYINALLAQYFLEKNPGATILHDTRVVRVIDDVVRASGGTAVATKAGHSFIKERMRTEDAIFGCETSGHYYFKSNWYLDNGMLPFLCVLDILSHDTRPFSEILAPLRERYAISEELNFTTTHVAELYARLRSVYTHATITEIDGLEIEESSWRCNVRSSNTEALVRVNVEATTHELLTTKIAELQSVVAEYM